MHSINSKGFFDTTHLEPVTKSFQRTYTSPFFSLSLINYHNYTEYIYVYRHIQDLLVSVDIRIIRSPSGLSISTGCPTVRFPTLSCPTAAAALDTVCPREEGRQFGGNGPMVLPGSCCSKLGDMWPELMGTRKILWLLALHDHYTSSLPLCNLPFGVSSGDMTFPQQTRLRRESFAKQNGRWKLKSPVRTCTVLISFNL